MLVEEEQAVAFLSTEKDRFSSSLSKLFLCCWLKKIVHYIITVLSGLNEGIQWSCPWNSLLSIDPLMSPLRAWLKGEARLSFEGKETGYAAHEVDSSEVEEEVVAFLFRSGLKVAIAFPSEGLRSDRSWIPYVIRGFELFILGFYLAFFLPLNWNLPTFTILSLIKRWLSFYRKKMTYSRIDATTNLLSFFIKGY